MSDPTANMGTGGSRTEVAQEEASKVASSVQDQGAIAAESVQRGGQQVVGEAKAQVAKLNEEAQRQVHAVLGQAQQELGERASEQTDKAASSLRDMADELQALAEGRTEDAARLTEYLKQASDRALEYADRLETRGFGGIVEDLSSFARRRPGLFLLGAIAAGFATGRFVRGAQKAPAQNERGDSEATTPIGAPSMTDAALIPPLPIDVLGAGNESAIVEPPSMPSDSGVN
jgi:hypothetical protein